MNPRTLLAAIVSLLLALGTLRGQVGFYSAPSNVQSGESYLVGADYSPPSYGGSLTIWKNGGYFSSGFNWGYVSVEAWTSDAGPTTVDYLAEGWDYEWGYVDYAYASITVAGPPNTPPVATVEVDGHSSGATVTRPYGGSVTVTVRYKATDGNGNLSGIRPQVWSPDGNLNNNGGSFIGQSGSSGEVVWTVVLNQNGDWYFWTDATDPVIAPGYTDSGSWTNGFRLTVNEAPPPNQPPTASVWANVSSLYTGQTAQIYVRGQDGDGNARYFNLDQVSPLNCFYGPGDNFVSSQQPNNGWWDLGSNTSDYTRTVNMAFDRPGTYVWRAAVMDSAGSGWQYSPTNHTITVPNRNPSVSIQILDAGQNVIGLDGNGRARIPINTNFYIRVSGADPDGRLLRLYSRVNDAAGTPFAYEQRDVSAGSATWTFGPYSTGTSVGVWDVWGHAEDQDNGGYQWQGGGWWGTQSPDVEVYAPNVPPTGAWHTLPPTTVSYGMNITARATGSDTDGNLASVWVDLRVNGAGWTAFAYNAGGNGYTNTSDANVVTIGAPGSTYAFRYYVADSSGANSGWISSPIYTAVKTTPAGSFAARTFPLSGTTYTIVAADLNATFANPYPGSVSAPTGAITYSVVGPGTAIVAGATQFGAGTYTIRATYAGDGNYNPTTVDATWTFSAAPTYTLSVENGVGGGSGLFAGAAPTITANTPPAGEQFSGWSILSGPGTFGNASATSTTFTMGNGNATVRANFGLPPNGDADGDGMPNGWETTNGLNPNLNDAAADKDSDGISNLAEYLMGTNPSVARQTDSGNGTQLRVLRPRS